MDQNLRSSTKASFLALTISFLLGAIFGLVVLGWVVWPVSWYDAYPATLNMEAKQDFLRATIDSYLINQDPLLAMTRFHALEHGADQSLAAIYHSANPIDKTSIERFAETVGAAKILTQSSTPIDEVTNSSFFTQWISLSSPWWSLFIIGVIIVLAILIYFLISSRKKRTKQPESFIELMPPNAESAFVENIEQQEVSSDTSMQEIVAQQEIVALVDSQDVVPDEEIQQTELPASNYKPSIENEHPTEYLDSLSDNLDESTNPEEDTIQEVFNPSDNAGKKISFGEETAEQTYAKFSGDLSWIPGFDDTTLQILGDNGITAPLLLLKKGASLSGREQISLQTGANPDAISKWVNSVDLLRIKGLSQEDVIVLLATGQESVASLANSDPITLLENINHYIDRNNMDYPSPFLEQLENWVNQAKLLPEIVTN